MCVRRNGLCRFFFSVRNYSHAIYKQIYTHYLELDDEFQVDIEWNVMLDAYDSLNRIRISRQAISSSLLLLLPVSKSDTQSRENVVFFVVLLTVFDISAIKNRRGASFGRNSWKTNMTHTHTRAHRSASTWESLSFSLSLSWSHLPFRRLDSLLLFICGWKSIL